MSIYNYSKLKTLFEMFKKLKELKTNRALLNRRIIRNVNKLLLKKYIAKKDLENALKTYINIEKEENSENFINFIREELLSAISINSFKRLKIIINGISTLDPLFIFVKNKTLEYFDNVFLVGNLSLKIIEKILFLEKEFQIMKKDINSLYLKKVDEFVIFGQKIQSLNEMEEWIQIFITLQNKMDTKCLINLKKTYCQIEIRFVKLLLSSGYLDHKEKRRSIEHVITDRIHKYADHETIFYIEEIFDNLDLKVNLK